MIRAVRLHRRGVVLLALALLCLPIGVLGYTQHQRSLDHDLLVAIQKGDSGSALTLLKAGANPNASGKLLRGEDQDASRQGFWDRFFRSAPFRRASPPPDAETALIWAIRGCQSEVITALLNRGAHARAYDRAGTPTVTLAVQGRLEEILPLLLEAGADPNATDKHGETPLMWATSGGNRAYGGVSRKLTAILLQHGADPNARCTQEKTPALTLTVERGYDEGARMLLEAGADVNVPDARGSTALIEAVRVLPQCYIADPYVHRDGPLGEQEHAESLARQYPAALGHVVGLIRLLLEHGAAINVQDHEGQTALMAAVQTHNPSLVAAILERHPDLSLKDKAGRTALDRAQQPGSDPAIVSLLKQAAAGK